MSTLVSLRNDGRIRNASALDRYTREQLASGAAVCITNKPVSNGRISGHVTPHPHHWDADRIELGARVVSALWAAN